MWIAVLAVGLIGIVTAQLVVLRLNTSIARALARAATLQRENAALAILDSEAGSGERIEAQAARLGMHAVPPGELRFMPAARRGAAVAAAQALRSTSASSATSPTPTAGGSSATGFVTLANGETALTQPTQESQQQSAASSQQPQEAAASAAVPGAQESQTASAGQAEEPAAAGGQSASTTPAAGQETQSDVQAGAAQAPAGTGG